MSEEQTTAVVQRYIDELAGDAPAEPIVRALLDRSVHRLQVLCANLLYRGYPRLMQPPVNLQPDELLGAVVERLLKALRAARPQNVREFFALANQHMRWELNDQAIDDLPEEEREVFDLVRIQGMTQVEAADVLGVSIKTVQRRLNRALLILSETLDDLRPNDD
jgi:DNA-binding CsgD family transcriptional regulator